MQASVDYVLSAVIFARAHTNAFMSKTAAIVDWLTFENQLIKIESEKANNPNNSIQIGDDYGYRDYYIFQLYL